MTSDLNSGVNVRRARRGMIQRLPPGPVLHIVLVSPEGRTTTCVEDMPDQHEGRSLQWWLSDKIVIAVVFDEKEKVAGFSCIHDAAILKLDEGPLGKMMWRGKKIWEK